jgi:hypothetical protein
MKKNAFVLIWAVLFSMPLFADEPANYSASPEVKAPADVVVSCSYWFSLGMLDDPNNSTFGRFVYGQNNIQKLKTIDQVCPSWCERDAHTGYDPDDFFNSKPCQLANQYYSPAHPERKYPLVWGWDGYVNNYTSAVEIRVDDRRQCGTGLIVRRFVIEDRGIEYYDDQHIWIVDCDPFYVSTECTDTEDDIEWPLFCQQPEPLDGCFADLSPDNPLLGRPKVVNGADNQCNLISIDFKDDTLTVVEDACLKVLRTWTVVDWCKYHPVRNPHQGRWEYLQVIKVRDKLDPEITCTVGDCQPAYRDSVSGECVGFIELRAQGMDSCTTQEHLRYEYKIDLFDDGVGPMGDFDLRVGPLSKLDETPSVQENGYALYPDSVLNASGTYPIGTHRIKWFVEDGCANVNLCDTTFEIKDCKAPTPYCKPGIITVVMPSTKSIEVWAKDLDDGSFDNCSEQLTFSFSQDQADSSRVFDCDSIGIIDVEVWVTDEEGNQDFCVTKIEIQDNQGNCTGNIGNVTVSLLTLSSGDQIETDDLHYIIFEDNVVVAENKVPGTTFNLDLSSYSGEVAIGLKGGPGIVGGITTKDAIGLIRHLLGIKEFDNYVSMSAADVNGDHSISAADISALRKFLVQRAGNWDWMGVENFMYFAENDPEFDNTNPQTWMSRHVIDPNNLLPEYQFRPVIRGDVVKD